MTIQGITFLLISSFTVAFIFFVMLIKIRQSDRNDSEIAASDLILGSVVSVLIFFLAIAISLVFIVCSSKSYTHYHTIYSNKMNANVKFVTDDDDKAEFVGGQPIKHTSETTTGTLTLSKNDTAVTRDINSVEFVGDVEKGSVVEKIEYSNSTRETKLFGVTLFKLNGWNDLKIHLKTPESKTLKEKQDSQNRKELNSLLDKE